MTAAALDPAEFAAIELVGPLGSFKELIERNASFEQSPELFCFGLLERFDVATLAALSAPARLTVRDASPRAQRELKPAIDRTAAGGE